MHSTLATAVIRSSLLPEIDNKHHLLHLWRFCMLNVRCVRRHCQYSGVWLLLGDKGECSPVKCKIACQGHGAGKEVLCKITTTFSWWLGRDAEMNVYLHNRHTNLLIPGTVEGSQVQVWVLPGGGVRLLHNHTLCYLWPDNILQGRLRQFQERAVDGDDRRPAGAEGGHGRHRHVHHLHPADCRGLHHALHDNRSHHITVWFIYE